MHYPRFILVALLSLIRVSYQHEGQCHHSQASSDGSCSSPITSDVQASSSSFGTRLFSILNDDPLYSGKNILISPLSIYQSLALLKDGATAQSENELEISQALGIPSLVEQARLLFQQSTNDNDSENEDVNLSIATSIWSDSHLKASFIETARSKHYSDVHPLPSSYSAVNQWISDRTKGLISKLFDESEPVDRSVVALLVNAVHFRGTWTNKFDTDNSIDGEFHLRAQSTSTFGKDTIPVRFMNASFKMKVTPQSSLLGGASVLVLDYGSDTTEDGSHRKSAEYSSVFILPASSSVDAMNNVIAGLNSQPISDILNEVRNVKVDLKLPRFRLKFGPSSLVATLRLLGINAAFNTTKGELFNQMSEDPSVYVDKVLHSATMEVTEEGTVAGAATAVVMKTRSIAFEPPPLELTFDRPFVVIVLHWSSGIPLFIGRVENPELV